MPRNKRITSSIFVQYIPHQRRQGRYVSAFVNLAPFEDTTSYTYNYMGLVATETNEKNATRRYTYDALGRLVSKTDRNGRITTYTYDTIGRLTSENWSDTTNYFMYTYDVVGNLLYATDGQHSYSYTYDALNRPIYTTFNFDSQSAIFAYTYDLAGRRTASSLSLNGHSDRVNQVTYDFLGNATKIIQTGSAVDEIFAEFDYNANGLMTSVKRYEVDGNNLINEIAESVYTYNANNAVTSITHKNPNGTQIVQHSYTYDNTNNIVEYLNSIDGQTSYDYDFLGQLIGADYANQNLDDETYTYDENGNRITANGDTYTTGDNNELTSDGTWSYTYDAEGNRISKTNATNRELYTWDHRNRLTSVTQQEWDSTEQEWVTVQTIEYAYDYNNVWIRKVIGNDKTIFIPENYQTTVQIDNNAVTHHYLWTPNQQDKLLADTTPTEVLWSLTDHLGTIRDILAATSTHLIYDTFGNLTSGTNPLLFGYTGKPFDADTALQNNINRWYDAAVGRWLSTDPIGFEGNDTNLYRYVRNLPTLLGDAWGQELQWNKYPWPTIPEYLLNVERFPGGQTLPSAETIQGDSNCYVYVHCSPVVAWGIDIGTHCGLTIDYNGKIVRFDGSGGDINQIEVRYGNLGHNPQTRFGIKTQHDSKVCECLLAYPENFNIHRIPRKHMQGNSNWTLSCMEKKCGLKINWNMWGPPSFYAVPPCKKYELTYRLTMQGPYCENACTEYYDCP